MYINKIKVLLLVFNTFCSSAPVLVMCRRQNVVLIRRTRESNLSKIWQ